MRCKSSALSSALRDFNGDAIRGYTLEAKSLQFFYPEALIRCERTICTALVPHFDSLYAAITPIVAQAMFMITR